MTEREMLAKGFRPIDELVEEHRPVEFLLWGGLTCRGFLMVGVPHPMARTFWTRAWGGMQNVKPVAFRPDPLEMARAI